MTTATRPRSTSAAAAYERRAIIYLRLSDFRDDDESTFAERERELREFAADLGVTVIRVAVENDLSATGRTRGASAFKTPKRVTTETGLLTFRTNRPVFERVVIDLQTGVADVLIVGDDSRIARNFRDGLDLLDAVRESGASAVSPDEYGEPHWFLTDGGSRSQVSAFQDRINDARRYSEEIAAKVAKGRRRWVGKSYQGGRRPYGYRVDVTAEQHARRLVIDETEADVLRTAADDALRGIGLKSIARELNERHVPTVTTEQLGTRWSAQTLRDTLLKPAIAGLAVKGDALVPAPWPHIIDRPTWERLTDLLTDPARRTNNRRGASPRWLVSCFATCGVCGGELTVSGGRNRTAGYRGRACNHMRRNAERVDGFIGELIMRRLEQPDAADLLRPAPRANADEPKLRAQRRTILARLDSQADMHMRGVLSDGALEAGQRAAAELLAQIDAQLAATDEPDQLAEFRGRPAREVWEALDVPHRRQIVQTLIESIVINRAERASRTFDPTLIDITWRPLVGAPVSAAAA